jgi:protein-S-isoprenylcysteine O-methyltransferase Ste14
MILPIDPKNPPFRWLNPAEHSKPSTGNLNQKPALSRRLTIFLYGVVCYAIFFATFVYAIGFVGNLIVPKSIDSAPQVPLAEAILVNALLLGVFAVQHSVMARPGFKRRWTRIVPKPAERSTYVLASSLALILLFWKWEPMGGVIWSVQDSLGCTILLSLFAFGWLLVLVATFLINHFDLFGLRHVTLYLMGREYTPIGFRTPGPYKLVRHPLYVGWFFSFWATPAMTAAHLLFALATTAYILVAIRLEEGDLVRELGQPYEQYRRTVPMLLPTGSKKPALQTAQAS